MIFSICSSVKPIAVSSSLFINYLRYVLRIFIRCNDTG
uniref:Uncharacterized protein n=1 Tax=virus sp. ctLTC15 TaxID=2826801 RepID=A0A8S5R7T1_9VIRU|nr:MAG TPA: hypothetical protein [virus sp. ctLTC15]